MYWKLVHGGGPCISRKNKEIDSPRQCGYMEAVFRMQCFGRMVIAKFERNELYWRNLSRNASEVRRVLAQDQLEKIEAEANKEQEALHKQYAKVLKLDNREFQKLLSKEQLEERKALEQERNRLEKAFRETDGIHPAYRLAPSTLYEDDFSVAKELEPLR